MAGLLEAGLTMCVCKMCLSIVGVRVVRGGSPSSVGLCCSSLLLLTDFTITLFLAFLRLADYWQVAFPISGDIIALRFLLFLTNTYGSVMLLTIPLVTVEMVFLLRWPHLGGTEGEVHGGKGTCIRGDECRVPLCPDSGEAESREASLERAKQQERHTSSAAILAHAVCVLSCLLAWCISGLRAERRWAQNIPTVELCLERYTSDSDGGGGRSIGVSLWHCLPSLLSLAWADLSEPCWGFLAVIVLLGHYVSLCLSLRPDHEHVHADRDKSSPVKEKGKEKHPHMDTHGQMATASMGLENVEVSLEEEKEKEQEHMTNVEVRVQMQTQPSHCAIVNPLDGIWTQSLTVDTETEPSKCHVLGRGTPCSAERRQAFCRHGKCCLSSRSFASMADRCRPLVKVKSGDRQMQDKQPLTSGQQPLRKDSGMAENMCFVWMSPQSDCSGVWEDPQEQLPCPRHCCQRWGFPGGSPCSRDLLIAVLVWGIFICLFPAPMGFSVLVIQHTETFVLFGLKVLWKTKFHDKHTESTRTEFMGS